MASAGELIAGMRLYADAKGHLPPERIKFPDNWLKEERWKENPKPPKPKHQHQPSEGSKASTSKVVSKTDKPKRQQATKGKRKETRKAAPASSGGGLAPQHAKPVAPFKEAERVQHRDGRTGAVGWVGVQERRAQVHWDDGGWEHVPFAELTGTDVTKEAGAQRNKEIRERRLERNRRYQAGSQLQRARQDKKLLVDEVADMARLDPQVVGQVEAGTYAGDDFDQIIAKARGAVDSFY